MNRLLTAARRNAGYKVLSIFIAVLLYYIAYSTRNPPVPRQVIVGPEVVGLPESLVVREPPRQVTIPLIGPANLINTLDPRDVRVTADASQGRPGLNLLPLEILTPPGVVVGPGTVDRAARATLERVADIQFGVDVLYDATPPAGYEYGEEVPTPSKVRVLGTAEQVGRVKRVVARVEKGGDEGTISRTVALIAEDEERRVVDGVEIRPASVSVKIPLVERPQTKNLLLAPVFRGETPTGYAVSDISFSPTQVTVTAAPEALSSRSRLEVPVDVSGLTATVTRTVRLTPPPGFRLQGDEAANVRIEVRLIAAPVASPSAGSPASTPTPRPSAAAPVRPTPSPSPSGARPPSPDASPTPATTAATSPGAGRDAETNP